MSLRRDRLHYARARARRLIAVAVLSATAIVAIVVMAPAAALASGCSETWAKAQSGSWSTASNWSPEKVPGPGDEVCITETGAAYTVTLTGTVSIKSLTLGSSSGSKQTLLIGGPLSSGNLNTSTASTINKTGVLNLESASGNSADLSGSATISNSGELLSSSAATNYLEANLTTAAGGTVDIKSGELRQDDNTSTTNSGTFKLEGAGTFAANTGSDKFLNKGAFSNAGGVTFTNGASWKQEAGSAEQSGNPVSIFGGTLTDVSGKGSFDLIDTTTLVGTVPAGQTVTADGIAGHNAVIDIPASVTNEGTVVLLSASGGGYGQLHGTESSSSFINDGLLVAQSEAQPNYLEVALTNAPGGTVEVQSGELRQDDNTTTINEGAFKVQAAGLFAATTGSDLFVNKGALSNAGSVTLTNGASWKQEAGSATQSGSPVSMFSGTLTDVSGKGSFDLIDSPTLSGTVPAGQTVTADGISGHNAAVNVSGTVTNEGTIALASASGGGYAELHGSLIINDKLITSQASTQLNYLEAPLTNASGGTVEVQSGELRQNNNTTTINEGTFKVETGGIFAADTGSDLFVNKGAFSNAGGVTFTNGASWKQEAGSATQSGSPVSMFSGTLTDVSGKGSFDLTDTTTLSGTVPAGQTVTAEAIPGHNSVIEISGIVTNEGTIALASASGGGYADLANAGSSSLVSDKLITSQASTQLNYLEVPFTNASGGTVEVQSGELRQDDNTTTINEGTFKVETGGIFAADTGSDLFVNKGAFSNAGGVTLTNGASWTQEAGSATQSGNPVSMFSGTLADVSGVGSFDLTDSPTLIGTVPVGQTVTADALPGHNAYINLSGTVTNDGTIALYAGAGGGDADIHGSQLDNLGFLTSFTEAAVNYLEAPLVNGGGGVVNVIAGELRQDDNTTTINEGTFKVETGGIFAADTGSDLFVNKGAFSNAGGVTLTNGASWTQEAASAAQSSNPVSIFGGTLTDASGKGSFDLIDTATLIGTVPPGQTVTADGIPGHNAVIDIVKPVINQGTVVLLSTSGGGYGNLRGTEGASSFINDGLLVAQSEAQPNYLEVALTNALGGTVEVKSGELRQDDNTTSTNEGTLQIAPTATFAATTGNDVITNSGKFEPDLASATSFGTIKLSNGATFKPGGSVFPDLVEGYAPPVGTEFNVITSSGAISGTFAKVENNFEGDYSKADIIAVKRERDSTAVALTTSPNPSTYGQPVTLIATITTGQGPIGHPEGPVKFFDAGKLIGEGTLSTSGGVTTASLTTTVSAPLPVGKDAITASYAGNANFKASETATPSNEVVNKAATSVTLEASTSTSTYGQPVKFTATVTGPTGVLPAPSGQVTFFDNGKQIGEGTVSTTGGVSTATFTSTVSVPLPVGKDAITASYSGDGNYNASTTTAPTNEEVQKASTSVTLEASTSTSTYGQPVKFTATVTGPTGVQPPPSGEVVFRDGSTELGKGTVSTSGGVSTATFTSTVSVPLPVGKDAITAAYSGDGNYKASETSTNEEVQKAATSLTLEASKASTTFGQPVKFTATVTGPTGVPPAPSGQVKFLDNGKQFGEGTLSTTAGVTSATFTTTAGAPLPVGKDSITASYSGDGNYKSSETAAASNEEVQKASTSSALEASSSTPTLGQPEKFTATVTGPTGVLPAPSGEVKFFDGATELGKASVSTGGGVSSATFTTSSLTSGTHEITAEYKGDGNYTASSTTPIQINVLSKPVLTKQPESKTVTTGEGVSFTAEATGNPTPTVQWEISEHGGAFKAVSGATSDTLTIASTAIAETSNQYEAVFTNSQGEATSEPATLTVSAALTKPKVTKQPESSTVTAGETASFTAEASGNPTPTVQWYSEAPGASSFSAITGATSTSYTTPAATVAQSGTKYEAVFTNSQGEATSEPATLTVIPAPCAASPAIEIQPAPQTVTAPAAASFTIKEGALAANCSAATIQWQVSTNSGTSWSNVPGASTATLQINPTSTTESGHEFRAVLSNAHGETTSNTALLTVNAPTCSAAPSITEQPESKTVTAPATATFKAAGSTPANCAAPTVQWYSQAPGASSFSAISGATSASYTTPATTTAQSGTKYEAVFSNSKGETATEPATLTVNAGTPSCGEAPSIATQPSNQTVTAPATATFKAAGSTPSGCSSPTVQWYSQAPGASSFSAISGATSASYTTPATTTAQSGTKYEAIFTNSFGSKTTSAATLTVNAPVCAASPAIETQPANLTVTAPSEASFEVKEGKVPANCAAASIQWQLSTNKGASWSNITGATSAALSIKPTSTSESGHEFRAVLTNAHGVTNSNAAVLTVNPSICREAPSITTQPSNQTVTAPATATFKAAGSTPNGCVAPTVQWYSEAPGAHTFSAISGAISASYTTPATTTTSQSGTRYEAVFTNSFGSRTTNAVTLTVNLPPHTPTVSLLLPNSGPAGSIVLIFGTNFTGVTAVDFGSVPARFYVLIPGVLVAQAPSGVSGTVDVTVHTATLVSPMTAADRFTFGRGSGFFGL